MISYKYWLELPLETRLKIAKLFGIRRTGNVLVTSTMENGETKGIVQSDGFTPDSLSAISIESLRIMLNDFEEKDFYKMVELVIQNVDSLLEGTYKPIKTKNDENKQTVTKQDKTSGQKTSTNPATKKGISA